MWDYAYAGRGYEASHLCKVAYLFTQVNYNDAMTGHNDDHDWNNDMSDFDSDFSGKLGM